MSVYTYNVRTPVGTLRLCAEEDALLSIGFVENCAPDKTFPEQPVLRLAVQQLEEYFSGKRTEFDLPLKVSGTEFQCVVWRQLQKIPYGQMRSYGQIAAAIGKPEAARAVGNACNKNNFLIVIPCHRVCAAQNIGGFALNLEIKRKLLLLEKPVVMGFSRLL